MKIKITFITILLFLVSSNANAYLVGRLAATEGGTDYQAYYDTEADLTWLTDANYAQTSGYSTTGAMSWAESIDWVKDLDIAGVSGWRLSETIDINNDGCNFSYDGTDCGYNVDTTTGELANLYYNVLGNLSFFDTSGRGFQSGYGLTNTGPFINVLEFSYWTATETGTFNRAAWSFNMSGGHQNTGSKLGSGWTWAVHDGDVSAVPVPAAAWLFFSGLICLLGLARSDSYHTI